MTGLSCGDTVVNSGRSHDWIDWGDTTKSNHMLY